MSETDGAYQDDQLDQTFATHEHANREALAPEEAAESRGDRTASYFGRKGDGDDADYVAPDSAGVEQAQVGLEAGECEVEWEEERSDEILNLLG